MKSEDADRDRFKYKVLSRGVTGTRKVGRVRAGMGTRNPPEIEDTRYIHVFEVMWCVTSRRQHIMPASALSVDGVMVEPVTTVRHHGIYVDADPSMRTHIQRMVAWCFAVLRQLRQIRRHLPPATFQTLVVALVISRRDYETAY